MKRNTDNNLNEKFVYRKPAKQIPSQDQHSKNAFSTIRSVHLAQENIKYREVVPIELSFWSHLSSMLL